MVEDYEYWEGRVPTFDGLLSCRVLSVPLKTMNRVIGAINITDANRTDPSALGNPVA
jgi:hypothetical protein